MKKFYLIATAVTMLTACTNSEKMTNDLSYDGPVMIGFETFHEKATKATPTGEIIDKTKLTKDHGGFGVWGYKGAPDDIVAASGSPNKTVDVSNPESPTAENPAKYTTIFENVQVWYVGNDYTATPSQGFTYKVPKYWDKGMEYIFFAYAPYDATNASINRETGNITIANIASIQDASSSNASSTPADDALVFSGSNTTGLTDYLMATYVTNQKLAEKNTTATAIGTNQNYVDTEHGKNEYTYQEQTVGFTFGHMLSRIIINLQAASQYEGVKTMKVSYLSIKNMPEVNTDVTTFNQISPTAPDGEYTTTTWPGKTLQIINTNSTSDANANATSKKELYILKGGYGKNVVGETETVTINPNEMTAIVPPTYQNQSFYYYVAPNAPSGTSEAKTDHYYLDINYTIKYVDDVEENVVIQNVDLNSKLASMLQNNSYTLTIKVGLNQIYFTVDAVTGWTELDGQEIEIK